MRNTFINELLKEATSDPSIMLLAGDLGYGVTDEFAKKLPNQYINFGINEQSMMSAAAGMASKGFKPFVYSIGNFPTFRCLEQIRNDVSYMNLNVTIVAVGAGFAYGTAGYSHHLIEDIGAMATLPNICVFSPADPIDAQRTISTLLKSTGPKYVRLGKGGESIYTSEMRETYPGVFMYDEAHPTAVISTGTILGEVREALNHLKKDKINIALFSISNLSSIPSIVELQRYSLIFTVEEHLISNGFGSIVNMRLSPSNVKIVNLGVRKIDSTFSGTQKHLRNRYELDATGLHQTIKNCLNLSIVS